MLQHVELYVLAAERELQQATTSLSNNSSPNNNNNRQSKRISPSRISMPTVVSSSSSTNTITKMNKMSSTNNNNYYYGASSNLKTATPQHSTHRRMSPPPIDPDSNSEFDNSNNNNSASNASTIAYSKKAIGLLREAIQCFVDDVQNWKDDSQRIGGTTTNNSNNMNNRNNNNQQQQQRNAKNDQNNNVSFTNISATSASSSKRLLNMSSASATSHPLAGQQSNNNNNNNASSLLLSPLSKTGNNNNNNNNSNFSNLTQLVLTSDLQNLHDAYTEQRKHFVSLRALHRWSLGMYRKQYLYATATMARRQGALENVVDHSTKLGEQFALRRQLTHVFYNWCTWVFKKREEKLMSGIGVIQSVIHPDRNGNDDENNVHVEGGSHNGEEQHISPFHKNRKQLGGSNNNKSASPTSPMKSHHQNFDEPQKQMLPDPLLTLKFFEVWMENANEIFSAFSFEKSLLFADDMRQNTCLFYEDFCGQIIQEQQEQEQEKEMMAAHAKSNNDISSASTSNNNNNQNQNNINNNNNSRALFSNHHQRSSNPRSPSRFSIYDYSFSSHLDAQRLNSLAVEALLEAHDIVRTNLLQCAATTTSLNYMMFCREILSLDENYYDDGGNSNNTATANAKKNHHDDDDDEVQCLVDSSSNPAFKNTNKNNNVANLDPSIVKLDENDPLHKAYMNLLRHNFKLRKDMRSLEGINHGLIQELQQSHVDRASLRRKLSEVEQFLHEIFVQHARLRDHDAVAFMLSASSVDAFTNASEIKTRIWLDALELMQLEQLREHERQLEKIQQQMMMDEGSRGSGKRITSPEQEDEFMKERNLVKARDPSINSGAADSRSLWNLFSNNNNNNNFNNYSPSSSPSRNNRAASQHGQNDNREDEGKNNVFLTTTGIRSSSVSDFMTALKFYLRWKNHVTEKFKTERDDAQEQSDVAWSRLETLTGQHGEAMAQLRALEKANQAMKRDAQMYQELERMNAANQSHDVSVVVVDEKQNGKDVSTTTQDVENSDHDGDVASSSRQQQRIRDLQNGVKVVSGVASPSVSKFPVAAAAATSSSNYNNNSLPRKNKSKNLFYPSNTKNLTQTEIDEIVRARCFRRWSTYVAARLRQRVYDASTERNRNQSAYEGDEKLKEDFIFNNNSGLYHDNDLSGISGISSNNQNQMVNDTSPLPINKTEPWAREVNMNPVHIDPIKNAFVMQEKKPTSGKSDKMQKQQLATPIKATLSEARKRRQDDDDEI